MTATQTDLIAKIAALANIVVGDHRFHIWEDSGGVQGRSVVSNHALRGRMMECACGDWYCKWSKP